MTSRSFYSIIDYMKDKDLNEIHRHHIVPKYRCKELGIDPNFDDNIVDITRLKHAEIHWGYKCSDLSALLEVCNPPQYVLDMIPLGDNRDTGAAQLLARGEVEGIVPLSGKDHPSYTHGLFSDMAEFEKGEREKLWELYLVSRRKKGIEYYENNKEARLEYHRKHYVKIKDTSKFLTWRNQYTINTKERKVAYDKKRYYDPLINTPEKKAQGKEYRIKTKEHKSEYDKKYCIKNKEKISTRQKEYRIKNKEKLTRYYKEWQSKKKLKELEKVTATLDKFL